MPLTKSPERVDHATGLIQPATAGKVRWQHNVVPTLPSVIEHINTNVDWFRYQYSWGKSEEGSELPARSDDEQMFDRFLFVDLTLCVQWHQEEVR